MPDDWEIANRISDGIVAILQKELDEMRRTNRIEPAQLLAGPLLAFKALERSMPVGKPAELLILISAVDDCLQSLFENQKKYGQQTK
jgi:hypothetical protein